MALTQTTLNESDLVEQLNQVGQGILLDTGYSFNPVQIFTPSQVLNDWDDNDVTQLLFTDYSLPNPIEIKFNRADYYWSKSIRNIFGYNLYRLKYEGSQGTYIAPPDNDVRYVREFLDLLFDNCIDIRCSQSLYPLDAALNELSGIYQINIIARHTIAEWDDVAQGGISSPGNWLVFNSYSDTDLFPI